ncbi:hypothetical protein JXA56_03345 [Candidatus Micrarchaeota archaeon]|nr:hypothetical protein [Candidatus Micrarchaeota archaeon]
MYTTSRYASEKTRRKAKTLGEFFSRGKKTISQLADMARKKGHHMIGIVREKNGAPCTISVISVNELGEWSWGNEIQL